MTVAHDIYPDNKLIEWGRALRMCRLEQRRDYWAVANYCGVSRHLVKDWEDGFAIPNHNTLRRLHSLFPRLQHYKELLPRLKPVVNETQEAEILKAPIFSIVESHKIHLPEPKPAPQPTPPSPAPTPQPPQKNELDKKITPEEAQVVVDKFFAAFPGVPEPLLVIPRTFGAALQAVRQRKKLVLVDAAKLVGVSSGTFYRWEADDFSPVKEHYDKLLEVMPELKNAPKPDSKNWQIPTGKPGKPISQEPVAMPQLSAMKSISELGAAYAIALGKVSALKIKADLLMEQALKAEDELKAAQAEANEAHESLKKATGG